MFEPGKEYRRTTEIHDIYGGRRQGGISTPTDEKIIIIFTSDKGHLYGYEDGFREDGLFMYTGEGQEGDMSFVRGNKAIRDHQQNGKTIHLFEETRTGHYRYVGECISRGYHWSTGPDYEKKNTDRKIIVFHLEINSKPGTKGEDVYIDEDTEKNVLRSKSLQELRKYALAQPAREASEQVKTLTRRARSTAIIKYALLRSSGICESCELAAPFESKSGPFLEVHHMTRVADGGPDYPENVIAVCPNCHRRAHYAKDHLEFNEGLRQKILAKES